MTKRGKLGAAIAVVAFAALLLYGTLSSQRAKCSVVVDYNGGRDSATASAATEADAEQQARTTACATLARGMNDRIACAATPPTRRECQRR